MRMPVFVAIVPTACSPLAAMQGLALGCVVAVVRSGAIRALAAA